jgi:hypothetical protein
LIHRTGHSDSIIAEFPWPGRSSGTFATISAKKRLGQRFARLIATRVSLSPIATHGLRSPATEQAANRIAIDGF